MNSWATRSSVIVAGPQNLTRYCCVPTRLTLVDGIVLDKPERLYRVGPRPGTKDDVANFRDLSTFLITASVDNTLQLWERERLALILPGHLSPISLLEAYKAPQRDQIVVISRSTSRILVWQPVVELPFIDFLVPLLNSALVFGVLGFAYFQTFFHKPKENLP